MLEGKPLFPGKDRTCLPSAPSAAYLTSHDHADVHQFSIITELLGTPPEDVIQTIASENVSVSSGEPAFSVLTTLYRPSGSSRASQNASAYPSARSSSATTQLVRIPSQVRRETR